MNRVSQASRDDHLAKTISPQPVLDTNNNNVVGRRLQSTPRLRWDGGIYTLLYYIHKSSENATPI